MSMTDDPSSMQRAFKRRRFQPDTAMDDNNNGGITTDNSHYHPFVNMSLSKNIFGGTNINNAAVTSMKRSRTDGESESDTNLDRLVQQQASEIDTLKAAKVNLEVTLEGLKNEHEKTINENRILKRAVTIQQERQTQASNELEAARQFKVDAETSIRRLEQMILQLRYHLQTQQSHPGNDFMGFHQHPPPDVY